MAEYSFLIKPASSLCNLRCSYCFYSDVSARRAVPSYGIMERETARKIIENVFRELKRGDEVSFLFQGGEPTLAGLNWFRDFVETAERQEPSVHLHFGLQTNGVLLDEEWCRFLKQHGFLVGLSLDGSADFHDRNRLDAAGKGTWAAVMRAKALLEKAGVEYNVLWVLTEEAARHPKRVWNFLTAQHIRYVQFIPCLDELDSKDRSPWVLTPRRFASFYIALFQLWYQALLRGEYYSVKFFDDVLNLLVKRQVTACGFTGMCQNQFVVEADGGAYPCDFYVLDRWRLGDLSCATPSELAASERVGEFLERERPDEAMCHFCPFENMCHGGCPRMNACMREDAGDYCGYREFLTQCREGIEHVASTFF